jgi:predicted DNA-binding protein YlxM (UPF0122 family)
MQDITRKELYELIWSEPTTKVAEKFQRSDVSLSKICKKYNIPKPPRGYWAKKNAGASVKQIPLPKSNDNPVIVFGRNPFFVPTTVKKKFNYTKKKRIATDEYFDLRNPHPIVRLFQENLPSYPVNSNGIIEFEPFKVSLNSSVRALKILNAVYKIIDEEECTNLKDSIYKNIKKNKFLIKIYEETEKYKKEIIPDNLRGRYKLFFDRFEWIYYPSGSLGIEIVQPRLFNKRKSWRDTKTMNLESQVSAIIDSLILYSKNSENAET